MNKLKRLGYLACVSASPLVVGCGVTADKHLSAQVGNAATTGNAATSTTATSGNAAMAGASSAQMAQTHNGIPSAEKPVAPEPSPTGDIPDTQAFITYKSAAAGYRVEAPEGWARSAQGSNVAFVDKLDGEKIVIRAGKPVWPSQLLKVYPASSIGRAVRVQSVSAAPNLPYQAVKLVYTTNSDPNPVTGKQVRLENNSVFFFKAGKVAEVTVWAPLGSDNVDQWNRIAHSFRW